MLREQEVLVIVLVISLLLPLTMARAVTRALVGTDITLLNVTSISYAMLMIAASDAAILLCHFVVPIR